MHMKIINISYIAICYVKLQLHSYITAIVFKTRHHAMSVLNEAQSATRSACHNKHLKKLYNTTQAKSYC